MEFKKIFNTDLAVAPICLGTVNYGTALPVDEAKRQLSQYIDLGGNFIDTAHIYGDWEPGLDARSERVIGQWLKETKNRERVVISTKGAHPAWSDLSTARVRPVDIKQDLDESLAYLGTDYVDLYFLHRDDPNVPVSEIIDYLDEATKEGKIRYYGCSNWTLKRIKEASAYARSKRSTGFVVNQLMWSLADINFNNLTDKTFVLMDKESMDYHHERNLCAMAYMSIAKGYFTRRHQGESLPESVTSVYENESNDRIYEAALRFVNDGEYTFMDLAFMYIIYESLFTAIPIASFDTPGQLVDGLSCLDKEPPIDMLYKLCAMKEFVYR